MKIRFITLLFSAVLLAGSGQALAQGAQNTIGVNVGTNFIGSVVAVEYERLINDHISVGARLGKVDYEWEDGSYIENGDGTGFDVTFRYYFRGQGFKGPYIGASIGRWSGSYDWVDGNARGAGDWDATNVTAQFGWVFLVAPNFSINPAILVGNFASSSTPTSGGARESEIGFYGAAMVRFAVHF